MEKNLEIDYSKKKQKLLESLENEYKSKEESEKLKLKASIEEKDASFKKIKEIEKLEVEIFNLKNELNNLKSVILH